MQIANDYVAFVRRHRWSLLGLALLLVVLSVVSATRLSVNSRLESLLPDNTPSAVALKELRSRLRSSSPLYLLIQSSDAALNRRLARQIAATAEAWPETRWAIYKRDASIFQDNRLLYLEAEDLVELSDQIDERQRWEECERLPGCSNLDDEPPPLPTEADLDALFKKNPDIAALTSLFGSEASAFSRESPRGGEAAGAKPSQPTNDGKPRPDGAANDAEAETGDLCSSDGTLCAVQVSLKGNASDLDFATEIYERSEAMFAELRPDNAPQDLRMVVSGQYRAGPMTRTMVAGDLRKTTFFSIALIVLVVMLQFRGLRSLLMLVLPAALGVALTAGILGVVHPELNMVSAFTLAVLAGVGIDFGVHLLTHFSDERGAGEAVPAALSATFRKLGPSLLVAALTTSCGFGALGIASFQGFAEMGPIAAMGILLTGVSYVLLFPLLAPWLDRKDRCPFELRAWSWSPWKWLQANAIPIASLGVLVVGGFGAIGVGLVGPGAQFEYNTRNLRPQSITHGIPWGQAMHGTSRSAVYLMADDAEALREVAATLRAARPEHLLRRDGPFMVVPAAFIPDDQPARIAALGELRSTLERAGRKATGDLKRKIDEYQPLASVEKPISVDDMPHWVTDWLVERDGSFGTLGILYTDLRGSDARQMEMLSTQLSQWRKQFPKVRFASTVAPLGEVTPQLRKETPGIVGLALLGVCLGTLLIGRSLRRTCLVVLPLSLVVALGLGLAALFDVRLNLYNMLVFPLAFGIGVDGAVYVTWALAEEKDQLQRLPIAGRAVLGSTLTSMAGFGALMISGVPGLASIGHLAVLMLGASVFGNLLWLPALAWTARRARTRPAV